MKKHIAIIAGTCYPISSANGAIALSCAKYLKDSDISLISIKHYSTKNNDMPFDYGTMYFVKQFRYSCYQRLSDAIKGKKGITKWLIWFALNFVRFLGFLEGRFVHIDNLWWFKKKTVKILRKINAEKQIDTVISINMPLESHIAAQKFKKEHMNISWVAYFADPIEFSSKKRNIFMTDAKINKMIYDITSDADSILATEEMVEWLAKEKKVKKNIVGIPYVLSEDALNIKISNSGTGIKKIIYMGTFYKTIRNPEYMLRVFLELCKEEIQLDLYAAGDCFEIIDKYVKESGGKIRLHSRLPRFELYNVISQSDYIINIDNENCHGKPSKLYELISFRKPIINFSRQKSEELQKYPSHIWINTKETIEKSVEKLRTFILLDEHTEISIEELRRKFYDHSEKYVAKTIVNVCGKNEKDNFIEAKK